MTIKVIKLSQLSKVVVLILNVFLLFSDFIQSQSESGRETLDLNGVWSFQLDPDKVGERERWFERSLGEEIRLPGSTDENGFGTKATEPELTRLTREHSFYGPAWYQKTIEIPESWAGQHVELLLERVMWESKVWLDDHYIGMAESLCAPHPFDLSDFITPGRHRLTLRIDNRYKVNIGHYPDRREGWSPMWTMAITDESQTTWNGVIGRMEITVSDPVWIERFETYPDLEKQQTRVVAIVRNRPGVVAAGQLTISAKAEDHSMGPVAASFSTKAPDSPVYPGRNAVSIWQASGLFYAMTAETRVEIILPFGEGAKLWDEFSPSLYELTLSLSVETTDKTYNDVQSGSLGLREFVADGRRLRLNGRTLFLRGNQDNCIHPLTGYPPMDTKSWLVFLKKYQDYGLNHIRFHSWCPPEAAFDAADQLGMMLQIETPLWDGYGNVGRLPDRAAFIRFEAERILDAYGNHPSFCMFSVGNELGPGTEHYLQYLVEVLRDRDNRHLYTCTSHPTSTLRNDDYHVGANDLEVLGSRGLRGLRQWKGQNQGDFRDNTESFKHPIIAHEIGQYASYPDYYSWFNPEKYTGHLKARYIDIFKKRFEAKHPAERGPAFARASGELQLLLYKSEIEFMLRTPTYSGFHLNGLSDYPGEGVALIGVLDALLDSKGIASPEEFRQFCSETVPLARLPRQTWSTGETFEAQAEVRHHGPQDLSGSDWRWKIADQEGKTLKKGSLGTHEVPTGELTALGTIQADLPAFAKASELTLTLWMEGSEVMNSWRFWVFPAIGPVESDSDVLVAQVWNDEVKSALKSGGRVLLTPPEDSVAKTKEAHFWAVFWGLGLFSDAIGSMGIYCDPQHPALAQFPTRSHSDWQWHDLITGSYALNINDLPFEFEPVVHMIDDFNTSDRLSLILEAQVGNGRLMICTLNLGSESERTLSQRQMLKSLLGYVSSATFQPRYTLTAEQLDGLF